MVSHFTKGASAAVLEPLEYDAIFVVEPAADDAAVVAAAADVAEETVEPKKLDLGKETADSAPADRETPEAK